MGKAKSDSLFSVMGAADDLYMGRYSRVLAEPFATVAQVTAGQRALDVGCGSGALTTELVRILGSDMVHAIDPSAPLASACSAGHPGVSVQTGRVEELPYEDATFDRVLAQLVLHVVADRPAAAAQMRRVTAPGGMVSACAWDLDGAMQMLRLFWDAALEADPAAPDEAVQPWFGRPGELARLFSDAGLTGAIESTVTVSSRYSGVDELWNGFLAGIGPAGQYCLSLDDDHREAVRAAFVERVPAGRFVLTATARCATGSVPT